MKNIKRVLFGLLILFLAIANVSAEDTGGNLTVVSEDIMMGDIISLDNDLISLDDVNIITNDTIHDYVDEGEIVIADCDTSYELEGVFEDLGVISIAGENLTISGKNAYFKNTAFFITGNDIVLKDMDIEVFCSLKDNDWSAILVDGDNVLLDNIALKYFVPSNVEAYAIQVSGSSKDKNQDFKLTNSMIYFEGHNYYKEVRNYGIFLFCADNALIYNNTIYGSLPLRNVTWDLSPTMPGIYRDIVLTIGAYDSDYLNFTQNYVFTEVNEIGYASYPTLDSFYIERCDNSVIDNNTMYSEDIITPKDIENYLYGIDVYGPLRNLQIIHNNLTVFTTGGTYAHGTAYPIQLSGPYDGIYIYDNDINSTSNGPNIGIYSQNSGGATNLVAEGNRIDVTGFAGTHEWALVSGIEAQDTDALLIDNDIVVHSIDEVGENYNLYGISYRQKTNGEHSFNVVNNTVFSEGYYAVAVLDAQNSNFEGNTLYTENEEAISKGNSLKVFDEAASSYKSSDNRVINVWDYYADKYNSQDGGEEFVYETPGNVNNRSNAADGSGVNPNDDSPSYNDNPLIPKDPKVIDNPDVDSNPTDTADGDSQSPDVSDGDSGQGDVADVADGDYNNLYDVDNPDGDPGSSPLPGTVPDSADGDPTHTVTPINYESWDGNNKRYTPSQPSNSSSSSSDKVQREYESWDGNGVLANSTNSMNDGEGDSDDSMNLKDMLHGYVSSNTEGGTAKESYNGNVRTNTTSNSPSIGESNAALGESQSSADSSSASSAGKSGQSSPATSSGAKSYEIVKDILENNSGIFIPAIVFVLIALFLLVVGYRRKQSEEF